MPHIPLKPKAILIDVIPDTMDARTAGRRMHELESLVGTYGGIIIVKQIQKRGVPDYRTYIGSGKLEELALIAKNEQAEVLIINNLMKPGQMYNVAEYLRKQKLRMQVWDRVDLILKIFAKHAKTSEAKLQIKLAAIRHMGPRIFGIGQEMMQQAGGTGTRGGQGETNTEVMKRHMFEQEKKTKQDLDRLATAREGHRKRRDRVGLKTVSVVGYTNAGKSSLVNALTKKGALVADALFATLDTHIGKLWLPHDDDSGRGTDVLISDTIGFIQNLPPKLIDAFRSTLDETVDADLLLHVIDASDPFLHEKITEVEEVLTKLKVEHTPKIYLFNKIDLMKRVPKTKLVKAYKPFSPLFVSAHTGDGLEALKKEIGKRLVS
ncbi:MAG: GTPase HflX [Candidatus Uhrbacteria bacterium]|nr:GTPase HflX [Candidatus Uhrbacteria bacterium]